MKVEHPARGDDARHRGPPFAGATRRARARIEVPLFEDTLSWLANCAQEYLVSGDDTGRMGNAHPTIVPYQTFDASDKPIAVGNDAQFK